ncbi:MAG TPA: metallophosphoesterase [Candidatus Angelobacter sp.]
MTGLRIWDFRRGDNDDNRSSPYSGGFRGLVLSTLLEFNYLKAPLSFVTLILLPALLVGIAPSIMVTYGRFLSQAATFTRRNLIVGLGLVAILLVVAIAIGRPFLSKAFFKARQLHYTLVFPIFIALREVLREGAERIGGRSMTPQQLAHWRRLGTVLAALIFAAAGLTLAMAVEFSVGFQRVDVTRASLWAGFKTALGNAAVILGLSTVLESLFWLWRELTLRSPVLDWVPGQSPAGLSTVRIAHLSDLHLVGERYGYRMETGTHGPRGNRSFRNALRKLSAIHARTPLDRVLVTGDITDAGTRAEWAEFTDLLRGCHELRERLSFVPGNHDVNIVDRTNPGRLDLPWSAGPALRKLRFVLALDAVQGDRAHVVDRASGGLGPSLRDYLRDNRRVELLRGLAESGAVRGRWEIAKIWDAIFPLVEPPRSEGGYGLILLDSNAPSHFSLTNAIGVVNPLHLKALKSVLRDSPGRAWIILLHHQVVEYPVVSISLRDRIGLALVNAPDVLAAIAPYSSRVLILHGHRHRDWIGTCGDVVLCSAPSVTMESTGVEECQGSFHVHDLTLRTDGGIRLATTQRVKAA